MRTLTQHKLNGLNDALEITVLDGPGAGNASHEYNIQWPKQQPLVTECFGGVAVQTFPNDITIKFQKGPIQENGVNGISGEALIAILIDRLEGFQSGSFSNEDNAQALLNLQAALAALQKRTKERIARGVEGKSIV